MIRHSYQSARPDGEDASVIRPSDWNAAHVGVPENITILGGAVTWTNQPSAATELPGTYRLKTDLTNADQVRIVIAMAVIGQAGSVVWLQYSTDQSAWTDLTSTVALSVVGAAVSSWANIPAGAKADVFLRIMGSGGNAVVDPQFRVVNLQVQ